MVGAGDRQRRANYLNESPPEKEGKYRCGQSVFSPGPASLNESPSKKEEKSCRLECGEMLTHASMKASVEKRRNIQEHLLNTVTEQASMKALPKRMGNEDCLEHVGGNGRASMKVPMKRWGNLIAKSPVMVLISTPQ